jgi:hypothetical protein
LSAPAKAPSHGTIGIPCNVLEQFQHLCQSFAIRLARSST